MINLNNTTPAAPSGQQNAAWQQDTSGNVSCNVPIPSVALTMPAEFSVTGSPVNGSGTLTVSKATQSANEVYAGPASGSAAAPTFRALVAADLPSGVGTVSSVALTAPAEFTVTGSPVTTSGTLAISKATQSANEVYAGPASGSAAQPTFRALAAADLPLATTSAAGAVKPDGTTITIAAGVISAVAPTIPVVLGFTISSGVTGTNVGPMLAASRAGSFSKCVVTTKASDSSTALTFTIYKNGSTIFSSAPTVSAGTASATVTTFTTLTSSPLSFSAGDVFSINITSGSSNWQFTAQLE